MRKHPNPGTKATVIRDITRKEGPYAKAGETGEILDTFPGWIGWRANRIWHAKVLMDADKSIKTFRLTSLNWETPPEPKRRRRK